MSIHVLSGVTEFDTSGSRTLDIPAVSAFPATGSPVPFLSSVEPDDPTDLELFRLTNFGNIAPAVVQPNSYLGARELSVAYTLTGGSPINVRFRLVWDTEISFTELTYDGS